MIHKKLNEITIADIEQLVTNNVLEGKTLEYKALPPENTDSGKKEFLADVSSLANTSGGNLIIGIKQTGTALENDIGIQIANIDQEIARLENIIRDGIAPRISVEIKGLSTSTNKTVIILRVRASLESPHRIIFKNDDKFYRRNSNGKYAMDVGELRSSFLQTSSIIEKIKAFRSNRVSDIKMGDTPMSFANNDAFISIHIVPLSAFTSDTKIDSGTLLSLSTGGFDDFRPFYSSGWSHRINMEGVITYTTVNQPIVRSYTQLYRNGIIEAVENSIISARRELEDGRKILPMYSIEQLIMEYTSKSLGLLSTLGFQPTFYVFVTLYGLKDFEVSSPSTRMFLDTYPITQNELLLPEVVIENLDDNIHHKFRPIFDIIWNASGVSKSLNFDDDNNFNERS